MNDDSEIREIQVKMQDCIANLRALAPMVGAARQVKEFNSDQRKNALAASQIIFIQRGENATTSEVSARSHPIYLEKLKALEQAYADACTTIAQWEAIFARFEACRSMLAMSRETLRTLDG